MESHGNRTNWFSWCSDNWNVRHSESWNSCIRSVEKIFSHKVKECNSLSLFFIKALRQNFESVTHAKYFELDIVIGLIRFSREVLDHALGTKIGF